MKTKILNAFNQKLETIRENSVIYSEILNDSRNLKLYELASFEGLEENDFEGFCMDSYNSFEEYLKELGVEKKYIGRTSTFYLNGHYFDMYKYDYHGQINPKKITYLICEYSGLDTDYITIDDTGLITDLVPVKMSDGSYISWEEYFLKDTDLNSHINDLTYYADTFLSDIDAIRTAYEYIDNFKDNQIEIFKEWKEC